MKKIFAVIAVFIGLGAVCLVAGGGLYTDGEPVGMSMTVSMTSMDSAALSVAVTDETGTGLAVFSNSPTFADDIQLGANGADGALKVFSEQGETDYTATIGPNATMTSAAAFYLPADEPAGTYLLNMTVGGVIGYDSSDYVAVADPGVVTADMIQSAAADLGAANVDIDLSNTNGSFTTDLTVDGNLTATETRADPVIGGGSGAYVAIKGITETVTIPVDSGLDPVVLSTGNLAPANSIIFGATARVTQAPGGGATTIDIGVTGSGNLDTLVDGMSTAATTTANTAANGDGTQLPLTNAAAAKVTLTTDADVTVSDMIVKVTVYYLLFSAQTS
jgi:hypothetical protein